MDYFFSGLGVFVGVLAGTTVTFLAALALRKWNESQQVQNLKFELNFNIKKMDGWLDEITNYRNAVNGDTLKTYFGYFDLSRIISVSANNMLLTGLLYSHLDEDSIANLQVIFSEFSQSGEQIINNQVTQNKQNFIVGSAANQWVTQFKPIAVSNIDFWEKKFRDHKATLQRIVASLNQ